ncbi:MAG: glycosyltransferase family 4 protein [Fuerstiella sp.]
MPAPDPITVCHRDTSDSAETSAAPPVRLLVVSGTLSGGGAERFVSTLLQHLNRGRIQPSLCLFRDDVTYPLPADVNVSILGHTGPTSIYRSTRRLAGVIDQEQPDVVLSVMDYLGMFVGAALRQTRHQPRWIARTSNSPEFQFRSWRGRIRRQWLNRVYPRADIFVANSAGLGSSFEQHFPCARGRTHVLSNPVDVQRLQRLATAEWPEAIDASIPNLFYSARLQAQKRPDVLIEAFRIVRQQAPARLWMCGSGPLLRKVESSIERHGLRGHVRMVGFRDNIFPLLKASTLAVATSDYEGLPNNILEAQALGVPVVSTRSSFGPEEIIEHEQTGLLAERSNPADVARAIIRLLSDTSLRRKMSTQAADRIEDCFSIDQTLPRWEDLILESATTASEPVSARCAAA